MTLPWYAFSLAFLLPFVDPRRPLRLLHLDLLVLVLAGVGPLHAYLEHRLSGSELPTVLCLTYLTGRLLLEGFRPRARAGPLVPLLSVTGLAVALVLVVGCRYAYVMADRQVVSDVGVASILGADRVGAGRDVYDERVDRELFHADTYGPVNYLFYVPFEQALPWDSRPGSLRYHHRTAARAAAIALDLLALLGSFILGRRLRPGREGKLLGLALAFAWASYPYSVFVLRHSFNDVLVTVLVLASVLALGRAPLRGAFAALAAAAKFAPVLLVPLLATGTGDRRARSLVLFSAAFVAVTLAAFLPVVPDGGLTELYDRTLGFQGDRQPLSSIWALVPGLDPLKPVAYVAVVGLALLLGVVPRRRSLVQVAALAAGLLAALELTLTYWSAAYLVWFAPLALAALFASCEGEDGREAFGPTPRSARWRTAGWRAPAVRRRPPAPGVGADRMRRRGRAT